MSLIENIDLLIEANREFLTDKNNNKLEENVRKLKYFFMLSLKDSLEKSIATKSYLENLLINLKKDKNMKNEEYLFIKKLHYEVEKNYLLGLKNRRLR